MDDFTFGLAIGAWAGCFVGIIIAALLAGSKEKNDVPN